MSNPLRLLSRLRQFGGSDVETYLKTEFRQNLKAIEDAFERIGRGPQVIYSEGVTLGLALPTTLGDLEGFSLRGTFSNSRYLFELQPQPNSGTNASYVSYTAVNASSQHSLQLYRTNLKNGQETALTLLHFRTGVASGNPRSPPWIYRWIDQPGRGEYEYKLKGLLDGGATSGNIVSARLVATEIT